jgi:hypothetical protein
VSPRHLAEPRPDLPAGQRPGPSGLATHPAVRWLGLAVSLAALTFVAREIVRHDMFGSFDWRPADLLPGLAPLVVAYALAGLGLAVAFRMLLWALAPTGGPGAVPTVGIYALTQINKYLPSNVLHLAGRHVLLGRAGAAHAPLLAAAVAELLLLLTTAGGVAMAGAPRLIGWGGGLGTATVAGAFALLGGLLVLAWRGRLPRLLGGLAARPAAVALAAALAIHLAFFVLSGGIAARLVRLGGGSAGPPADLLELAAVMSFAWAAGFVTPGLPAGIGVREGVLILGLGALMPPALAAYVATTYRLVTLAGDALLGLVGAIWWLTARPRAGLDGD